MARGAPHWPNADQNPALFLNTKGGRLTARAASGIIRAIARNGALDDEPTAHVLRHTLATTLVRGHTDLVIVAELLGHARLETTRRYSLQPSGIAPDGRETPGHQVIVALERRLRPICGGCLSRADTRTIPSDARYFRQRGRQVGVQINSLAAAPLPLLGALVHACGAGRLAHEPCGHQSDACCTACWTGIQTVPISDSAITSEKDKADALNLITVDR